MEPDKPPVDLTRSSDASSIENAQEASTQENITSVPSNVEKTHAVSQEKLRELPKVPESPLSSHTGTLEPHLTLANIRSELENLAKNQDEFCLYASDKEMAKTLHLTLLPNNRPIQQVVVFASDQKVGNCGYWSPQMNEPIYCTLDELKTKFAAINNAFTRAEEYKNKHKSLENSFVVKYQVQSDNLIQSGPGPVEVFYPDLANPGNVVHIIKDTNKNQTPGGIKTENLSSQEIERTLKGEKQAIEDTAAKLREFCKNNPNFRYFPNRGQATGTEKAVWASVTSAGKVGVILDGKVEGCTFDELQAYSQELKELEKKKSEFKTKQEQVRNFCLRADIPFGEGLFHARGMRGHLGVLWVEKNKANSYKFIVNALLPGGTNSAHTSLVDAVKVLNKYRKQYGIAQELAKKYNRQFPNSGMECKSTEVEARKYLDPDFLLRLDDPTQPNSNVEKIIFPDSNDNNRLRILQVDQNGNITEDFTTLTELTAGPDTP